MSHAKPRRGEGRDILDHLSELIDEDSFLYLRALLGDLAVASVHPSSKFLIQRVLRAMDLRSARVVVEFGAADGVITRQILPAMHDGARLVAIERNAQLCRRLERLDDRRLVAVHGDVRRLGSILSGLGLSGADVIVSGVPFSLFRPRARHELLCLTSDLLRPGGRFVAYQMTTHLIPLLSDYFSKVETEFEVRNIPPLFVFKAFK
ncbi:MAG: methyltransferase type 12 [Elusimicrobia bacterium]|nr:methyltransferase type 12 [Elusimicrobiota bacterium]